MYCHLLHNDGNLKASATHQSPQPEEDNSAGIYKLKLFQGDGRRAGFLRYGQVQLL